jgi:hypothetical protein
VISENEYYKLQYRLKGKAMDLGELEEMIKLNDVTEIIDDIITVDRKEN